MAHEPPSKERMIKMDHTLITRSSDSPERRLMLAMLERAILDYAKPTHKRRFSGRNQQPTDYETACEWLFTKYSTVQDEFSLPHVCQVLGSSIHLVRKRAKYIRKQAKRLSINGPWLLNSTAH